MERTRIGTVSATHWAALAFAIVVSQGGQLLLKLGATELPGGGNPLSTMLMQMLRWQTMTGLSCYAIGTLFYAIALRRIPMSIALPCTAISYVSATLFGLMLFGEALTMMHLIGLAMVCGGVLLLAGQGEDETPATTALQREAGHKH